MTRSIHRWTLRIAVGLTAALAAATLAAPSGFAAPSGSGAADIGVPGFTPETARMAADVLAADTGVSRAEAARRLASQDKQAALGERITAQLGSRASGFWLDQADGKLVVDVTDAAAATVVRGAGARPRLVSRSAARLAEIQRDLTSLLPQNGTIGTDVAANQLVVTINAAAGGAEALVAAAGRYGSAVRVEYTTGDLSTAIAGGHPINSDEGAGCSLGFNVTGGLALTAGHCTAVGSQWRNGNNNRYFGPSVGSSFPGNDFGLIRNDGNLAQYGTVYDYNAGSDTDIVGAADSFVGMGICKSGRTTGTTCARVDQVNVTVNYAQGAVYGLVRAELCVRPGDSGGAVFSGTYAVGLVSGVLNGTCLSYYQPVVEALLAYGVDVF